MDNGISTLLEMACRSNSGKVAIIDRGGEKIRFETLFGAVLSFAEIAASHWVVAGSLVSLDITDPTVGNVLRAALLRLGATVIEGSRARLHSAYGLAVDLSFVTAPTSEGDIVVTQAWLRPPETQFPVSGAGRLVRSTTGTTGTPKLRVMSELALASRWAGTAANRGDLSGPIFVGYRPGSTPAFNHFFRSVCAGQTVIQPQGSDANSFDAVIEHKARMLFLSPFNFERLLGIGQAREAAVYSLERIVVGGGSIAPARAQLAEDIFGCPVINTYGSNETSGIASSRPAKLKGLAGVVGNPQADVEVRLVPFEGSAALPESGEIVVRSPHSRNVRSFPDEAPICDAGGWVATGDIGKWLADGQLQFLGRRSELLNVGGTKLAPSYFEDLAREFPKVSEVAAFAVPSITGSDIVGVAVVAADGFDLEGFGEHMVRKLGPVYPLQIGLVSKLMTNEGGKVDRRGMARDFVALQNQV